jgi:hypothetical protein
MLVKKLQSPITLYNIDMTPNCAGMVTHTEDLQMVFGEHVEKISFYVTDIGPEDMVLGITWLQAHNPKIDWTAGKLSFTRCMCPGLLQGASPPEVSIQSDNVSPLQLKLITTNRHVRRKHLKAGILSHATNKLYTFASYTYSQKVAEDSGCAKLSTCSKRLSRSIIGCSQRFSLTRSWSASPSIRLGITRLIWKKVCQK